MKHEKSPVVAVYASSYLPISGTFIYRQLKGIADEFAPIVLSERVQNPDVFPFAPIYAKPRSRLSAFAGSVLRRLTGAYADIGGDQHRYWRDALDLHRARLIHAHFGPGGMQMKALAAELGIPLLVTFHGVDASALLQQRRYRQSLEAMLASTVCIAVSDRMAATLQGLGATRVFRHYIGVPVEHFTFVHRTPIREKVRAGDPIRLLQVANFVEKKGHRYTLEAFRGFLKQYPKAHLTLAGAGPLRSAMEARCRELGIDANVEFVGRVDSAETVRLMQAADAFVHHSVTSASGDMEGLPTVVLEAMSTGLPVVSTVHAGIPEAVLDGETGYLVPERDVDAYTSSLVAMLDHGLDMGTRGHERVANKFSMIKQNELLKGLYRAMMEGHEISSVDLG